MRTLRTKIRFAGVAAMALGAATTTAFAEPPASAPTPAPSPANPWKVGLTARYRFESANRYNLSDGKQFSSIRLRPDLTFTGIPRLRVYAEPQFNKILGASTYSGGSATANVATETSGNAAYSGSADTLAFRSALLDLSLAEEWNLLVGRQVLGYGDQFIVGPADWAVYGRSFDAVLVRHESRAFSADFFQSKIVETTATGSAKGGDKALYGFYGTYRPDAFVRAADLYAFYLHDDRGDVVDPADATRPWHFGTYGARVVTRSGPWAGKAEVAANYGSEGSSALSAGSDSDMLDTRVDYQFAGEHPRRVGLQLFRGGKNWRELYPTPYEPFGRTDVLGRRNVAGGGLHLVSAWSERWTTTFAALYFLRTSTATPVYQPDARTALGGAGGRAVGSELDLVARYRFAPNLFVSGGGGVFFVGSALRAARTGDPGTPTYFYLMLEAKY